MQREHFSVRDRRKPRQFSVENVVFDEWYPIIGATGYAFYSLLVRLARRGEERSYPGYTLISGHLGVGRSTVAAYAKLIEFCGLVHVRKGNAFKSNDYFILEPSPVTGEGLEALLKRVQDAWPEGNRYRKTFEQRIRGWRPLEAHFASVKRERERERPAQARLIAAPGSLVEHPSPPVEHPSSLVEHPSPPVEHPSPLVEHPSPPVEHPSATRGLEQSLFNNPYATRGSQQGAFVVVDDGTPGGGWFAGFLHARSRVVEKGLAAAFDEAGIVAEVTREGIVLGNPGVTADDVRAWAAYRDRENRNRPGACSTAVIINYLRSGRRAPADCYQQTEVSLTIMD